MSLLSDLTLLSVPAVRILCIIGYTYLYTTHPAPMFCLFSFIVLALSLYVTTAEAGHWRHGYMNGRHHTGTGERFCLKSVAARLLRDAVWESITL